MGQGFGEASGTYPAKIEPSTPIPTGATTGVKDVRANCFCASLLRTQSTSRCHLRHASSARAVEEMWRYIALVGTLN